MDTVCGPALSFFFFLLLCVCERKRQTDAFIHNKCRSLYRPCSPYITYFCVCAGVHVWLFLSVNAIKASEWEHVHIVLARCEYFLWNQHRSTVAHSNCRQEIQIDYIQYFFRCVVVRSWVEAGFDLLSQPFFVHLLHNYLWQNANKWGHVFPAKLSENVLTLSTYLNDVSPLPPHLSVMAGYSLCLLVCLF